MSDRDHSDSRPPRDDSPLNGVFRGLGSMLELLNALAREAEQHSSAEYSAKHDRDQLQSEFRLQIRSLAPPTPRLRSIPPRQSRPPAPPTPPEAPAPPAEREPLVDLFDEGAVMVVVVELTGIEQDLRVRLEGDVLQLELGQPPRWQREVLLPALGDPRQLTQFLRNGIVTISIPRQTSAEGDDAA